MIDALTPHVRQIDVPLILNDGVAHHDASVAPEVATTAGDENEFFAHRCYREREISVLKPYWLELRLHKLTPLFVGQ